MRAPQRHVLISGVKMLAEGDRICASVLSGVPFEPDSLEKWGEVCRSGGTVLDIGAYTGLYSIKAALSGARPIAFEPLPFNRARMKANAALNRVKFSVNMEAVSDYCGEAKLTWNPKIPYTSGASLVRRKGERMDVPVLTVDSLELKELTAMKIDVERAEPSVLAGAIATIKRLRPIILLEVLDQQRATKVWDILKSLRYKGKSEYIDQRNWLMVPR